MPTVPDNIILNKTAIIERSLKRMKEEYLQNPELDNYTHIDAMILNIERACQTAIDLAQHLVAVEILGMPQSSADAFILLARNKVITSITAENMVTMTGFRNIAIYEYQSMDMDILRAVAEKEYKSIIDFCREAGGKIVL